MLLTFGSGKASASAGIFNTWGHQEHNLHDDEWINSKKEGGQQINRTRRKGEEQGCNVATHDADLSQLTPIRRAAKPN